MNFTLTSSGKLTNRSAALKAAPHPPLRSSSTRAGMENYRRVEQPKPEQAEVADNEVLVTSSGRMRSYIAYATKLLTDGKDIVVVKAMGKSVAKCVVVSEIVKRRIVNLHQIAEISSIRVTDVWEPLEDGLARLETTRHVSVLSISLSSQEMNASVPGYQAPLPADQVKPLQVGPAPSAPQGGTGNGNGRGRGPGRGRRGRGRGRGRGWGRQPGQAPAPAPGPAASVAAT